MIGVMYTEKNIQFDKKFNNKYSPDFFFGLSILKKIFSALKFDIFAQHKKSYFYFCFKFILNKFLIFPTLLKDKDQDKLFFIFFSQFTKQ